MYTFNGIGTTIYGRANALELSGQARIDAEGAGYLPRTYQVVKWFVFIFLPVVPLGTYRVMKLKQGFWSGGFPRYHMTRINWDWRQVAAHYVVAYGGFLVLFVITVFGR